YAGFAKPEPLNFSSKDYPGDNETERTENAFKAFRDYRNAWNLLHETAGPADSPEKETYDEADLADNRKEYDEIKQLVAKADQPDKDVDTARLHAAVDFMLEKKKVTPAQIKMLAEQAKVSETAAKAMV